MIEASKKAASKKRVPAKRPPAVSGAALEIQQVGIDKHCVGSRWTVADFHQLVRLIATIAMGQATHAAKIIADLQPAAPALDHADLRADAKDRLSIHGNTKNEQNASRWHRDGLIFEAISWIAANEQAAGKTLIRDPHLSSTTQGLDGLMIELDGLEKTVTRATIIEDKCSNAPRKKFRAEIIPAFQGYHDGKRAAELLATAAALLKYADFNGTDATKAAAKVLDRQARAYRGGLTIGKDQDNQAGRAALFKGYHNLKNITQQQRVGATFIPPGDLRDWFDSLAAAACAYIDSLSDKG